VTGQEANEALEAINTKIGELEQLLAEIRAGAAVLTDEIAEIDEELARALEEGAQAKLPAIIRRRLDPCGALGVIGDCLRLAARDLEVWRDEREPLTFERLVEPLPTRQITEEELAAARKSGRRAA
jgi:hypothetical protein